MLNDKERMKKVSDEHNVRDGDEQQKGNKKKREESGEEVRGDDEVREMTVRSEIGCKSLIAG